MGEATFIRVGTLRLAGAGQVEFLFITGLLPCYLFYLISHKLCNV